MNEKNIYRNQTFIQPQLPHILHSYMGLSSSFIVYAGHSMIYE